ncbi:MAG: porin [Bacteroidaceae bacterium]|nr:porin [Bacteroidaceae bacterium]MBR3625277.1 porin [Bacteroidaceae bacterium]
MKKILTLLLLCFPLTILAQQGKNLTLSDAISSISDRISIGGFLQGGYDYNSQTEESSFYHKRAAFNIRGRITDRWTAFLAFEYSNSTSQELWTEYKLADELSVRVGQFKTMFGLENMTSPAVADIIDDASMATRYYVGWSGDVLQGNHAGRDIGLLVSGDIFNKVLHYDLSLMNGQGINRRDGNKAKDIALRLIYNITPEVALSGSYYDGRGHAIASSEMMGIERGEDYNRDRWALGGKLTLPKVKIRAEYLGGKDGHIKSEGWYALGVFTVAQNVDLLLNYDYFNQNKRYDLAQTGLGAGLQWWFYQGCRLRFMYTNRDVKHADNYNLLQAAFQVSF